MSSIAACAALAGPVAGAQASDSSVRATINSYNVRIIHDEARILNAAATYDQSHQSAPLIGALDREVGDLHALEGKLAHESASTARGRKGKADVVKGLGLIAGGYSGLAKAVQAASAKQPVSAHEVNAARASDKAGHNLVVAGLKLLAK